MASELRTETSSAETSPPLRPVQDDVSKSPDAESGYASATSSVGALPHITLTKFHLDHLNAQLERMHPVDVLRFAKVMFPRLYQSTAFGLTGLVTLDMLSKIQAEDPSSTGVPLIFLDTLYHFRETYDLVDRVRARYPGTTLHVFRPDGVSTTAEFESTYGERLYETAGELYDWIAKVEPLQRAYAELGVAAVLTGRRRSQGGQRDRIPVVEVDEERGVVKINPLVTWSFQQVRDYVRDHDVPYNALLDRGYKSVGDWHSTSPVGEGEDERAGRWKGQEKTECGIHNKKSRYAQFLAEKERRAKEQKIADAFETNKERHVEQPQPMEVEA
ncbi:Phosphoadenosine phosphosulfate reductase [Pleurostoma richardsiae]|uniref:phosphoadenylyl-sulfate reductase (thioredoxin) n=1 Tax=Pleurostoma richardsiae TaxID=41990 RepID=A0AA38RZ56_9PEZI|nr:Phosphoadenosine phosphosulfate reductase [Pleurostoma richardsiae]